MGWGRDYNIKEKTTSHDAPHQLQQIQLMFSDSQDSFLPPLSMQFCVVLISPFLIVFGIERDVKVRGGELYHSKLDLWRVSLCQPISLFLFEKDES